MRRQRRCESALETLGGISVALAVIGVVVWFLLGCGRVERADPNPEAKDENGEVLILDGFTATAFYINDVYTVSLTNKDCGRLTQVKLTFSLDKLYTGVPIAHTKTVTWGEWNPNETKEVSTKDFEVVMIPRGGATDHFQSGQVEGNALLDGKRVKLKKRVYCVPPIDSFGLRRNGGFLSSDYVFENEGDSDLTDVNVDITIHYRDGQVGIVNAKWDRWASRTTKTVNRKDIRPARVEILGTAYRKGATVQIKQSWKL